MQSLSIDEECNVFSDDHSVMYDAATPDKIAICDRENEDAPLQDLTDERRDVVFSDTAIILYLTAGPLPGKGILLSAPVTVGDVFKVMTEFYSTPLTAAEHAALKDWKYGDDHWPHTDSEKHYRIYGDIQSGHYFEGLKSRKFVKKWWMPSEFLADRPNYPPYRGCRGVPDVRRQMGFMNPALPASGERPRGSKYRYSKDGRRLVRRGSSQCSSAIPLTYWRNASAVPLKSSFSPACAVTIMEQAASSTMTS